MTPARSDGPGWAAQSPADRFDEVMTTVENRPGVQLPGSTAGRGFGRDALKVNGKITAMLTRGELVVKLRAERVVALLAEGRGRPFDAGKGKPMSGWLVVAGHDRQTWLAMVEEAVESAAPPDAPKHGPSLPPVDGSD